MKQLPLTGPDFLKQTPETFWAYCKSLIVRKASVSTEVSGFAISFMPTRTTVRTDRKPKFITRDELVLLAKEYKKTEEELVILMQQRKVEVRYADNDTRREADTAKLAEEKQRNAKPKKARKRKASSEDQLLKPVDNARLHEESPIQPGGEIQKQQ